MRRNEARPTFEHDERARDEGKVLGHRKREIEEDLVQIARDRSELAPLRRHRTVLRRPPAAAPPPAAAETLARLGGRGEAPLLKHAPQRRQQRLPVHVRR